MYRPQVDTWHDKDSNPMDVDTPKRLSETPLDRVQDDHPDLFTPKGWRQLKEAYGEELPEGLPIENPEKYL